MFWPFGLLAALRLRSKCHCASCWFQIVFASLFFSSFVAVRETQRASAKLARNRLVMSELDADAAHYYDGDAADAGHVGNFVVKVLEVDLEHRDVF